MAVDHDQVAAAVAKILKAARSVDSRFRTKKLTALLVADRTAIIDGLAALGDVDVPVVIQSAARTGSGGTSAPNIPAPTADILGPTAPTGLTATPGPQSLTWEFDQATDLHDGTTTPVGLPEVAAYDLDLNGVVTQLPRLAANIGAQPTFTQVGSPPGSPTGVQNTLNRRQRLLVVSGLGWDGDDPAGDQFAGDSYGTVTGPFVFTAKVVSFASSNGASQYAMFGLRLEDNADASSRTAKMIVLGQFLEAGNRAFQVKRRLAVAGSYSNLATLAGVGSGGWVQVERQAGNLFIYRVSFDGGAWTELGRETRNEFSNTLRLFTAGHALHASATANVVVEDAHVYAGAKVSTQGSTSVAVSARVRARDALGNLSPWSPTVTRAPQATQSQLVRRNSGKYVRRLASGTPGMPGQRMDQPGTLALQLDFMGTLAGFKGIYVSAYWAAFQSAKGDFSRCVSWMDPLLQRAHDLGLQVIIGIQCSLFGDASLDNTEWAPDYIVNDPQYGGIVGAAGQKVRHTRFWDAKVNDELIALCRFLGARYNPHPNFEMIVMGESSVRTDDPTFSQAALLTQWKRLITAQREAFPNAGVWVMANDGFNEAGFVELYNHCKLNYCAVGGPDMYPADITQADRIFAGYHYDGSRPYEDLRGKLPWVTNNDWQSFDLLPNGALKFSLQQLWDMAVVGYTPTNPNVQGNFPMPSMLPDYSIWYVNESNGNVQNQWATAEKAFLLSKTLPPRPPPTLYPVA